MNSINIEYETLNRLREDIRKLIDLSFQEADVPLEQWLSPKTRKPISDCWKEKSCVEESCPAYMMPNARCWLTAGTLCDGEIQGHFEGKYRSCRQCEVYQSSVLGDPLTEIEEHLIILVHNLKARQDQVKALALTDPLTGLRNRRYFDLIIPVEIERNHRSGGAIYLTMLDVDNFKSINDKHGHPVGDEILQEVAGILSESARKSDFLVRWGGDEFLIVSPTLPAAPNAAEKLRQRITAAVDLWNRRRHDHGISLSISMGHSVMRTGDALGDVLRAADEKMYVDKRTKH